VRGGINFFGLGAVLILFGMQADVTGTSRDRFLTELRQFPSKADSLDYYAVDL